MNTKTPEERAEERFPAFKVMDWTRRQDGYATCIREEVEPLEAEVSKLRALVQGLGNALCLIGSNDEHSGSVCEALHHSKGMLHEGYEPCPGIRQINKAMESFNEHGFVPTNTQDQ